MRNDKNCIVWNFNFSCYAIEITYKMSKWKIMNPNYNSYTH